VSRLWPRLPDAAAERRYNELQSLTVAELSHRAATHDPAQIFAATGGIRATDQEIETLRATVVGAARVHGFPDGALEPVTFDRLLAPQMLDLMGIVPAEAASRQVWSFLSLVVAPDVTRWRFPGSNRERWIASDTTRHMFSRLWWQAYLLVEVRGGAQDTTLMDSLAESDLNQLLERTTLGGSRPLVRHLARAVVNCSQAVGRRELMRESAIRMRRRMAFIDHLALDDVQLELEVSKVVAAAADSLIARGSTSEAADPGRLPLLSVDEIIRRQCGVEVGAPRKFGESLWAYAGCSDVRCPTCAAPLEVCRQGSDRPEGYDGRPWAVVCPGCNRVSRLREMDDATREALRIWAHVQPESRL